MYYVDTKGLGSKRTQKCIDALVTLGYKRVDGIDGMNKDSKMVFLYGEFRYVGVTSKNQVMLFDNVSSFALRSTPITYKKLMEMANTDDN